MKKTLLLIPIFSFLTATAVAQTPEPVTETKNIIEKELQPETIIPIISETEPIPLGEPVVLNAGSSTLISPSAGTPHYSWVLDDEIRPLFGKEISYTFEKPGLYEVKLGVKQGNKKETTTKEILVYQKQVALIAEPGIETQNIINTGEQLGVLVHPVSIEKKAEGFAIEKLWTQKLSENWIKIRESDSIMFASQTGFQGFLLHWKNLPDADKQNLSEKNYIRITEENLKVIQKNTQPLYQNIKPPLVLLTRPEAVYSVFGMGDDVSALTEKLNERGIENQLVDGRSSIFPALLLSQITSFFVTNGVSPNVLYLLFSVPFLGFVIAFFRQFIGISTFGVFAPLMLAMSFLVLGVKFGLLVFGVILVVSHLIRAFFEKIELLYIPRVALLLSMLALSFFLVLGLAIKLETTLDLSLVIFPMMVMSTISEKFIGAQSSSGLKSALILTGETVMVSLVGYYIVTLPWLQNLVLSLPELIFIPILALVWLGRFSGLRISEYFKFRTLLGDDAQE